MTQCILKAEHVKKSYITKRGVLRRRIETEAVSEVSFELYEGEILSLVGESGCGKSTLAKMLVKMLSPDSGVISLYGKDISGLSEREFRKLRTQVQLIQQNPFDCFDPRRSMRYQLSEGIRDHKVDTDGLSMEEYLVNVLAECDLSPEYLSRFPHELSGGQLQRLAIARAIALKPHLLLADEVVSALDISVQAQVLDLLIRLKQERKMCVIFITHDLAVARRIADRIIVMLNGKVVDEGTTEYIFRQSQCEYTKQLINAMVKFTY